MKQNSCVRQALVIVTRAKAQKVLRRFWNYISRAFDYESEHLAIIANSLRFCRGCRLLCCRPLVHAAAFNFHVEKRPRPDMAFYQRSVMKAVSGWSDLTSVAFGELLIKPVPTARTVPRCLFAEQSPACTHGSSARPQAPKRA